MGDLLKCHWKGDYTLVLIAFKAQSDHSNYSLIIQRIGDICFSELNETFEKYKFHLRNV